MAKTRVYVLHDETGRIVSIGQPADGVKAILLSGDGQSAFETEVDEDAIGELVSSSYIADPDTRTVKPFVGEARNDRGTV